MSLEFTPEQSNDLLRQGVLTLISKINIEGLPVGGVLSAIIGLFWEESDKSLQTWERVRKYAEDMTKQIVDKERISTLGNRLAGLQGVAVNYKQASLGAQEKGQHLINLIDHLTVFEKDFWDERNPEKMFPLFSTFGTLWIFALAEQAYYYKEVFGVPDRDASLHVNKLKTAITKYTGAAQRAYDSLYAWRFSLLQVTESQTQYATQSESEWKLVDKYDDYTKWTKSGDWGHSYHNPSGQHYIEAEAAVRATQIQNSFVEQLQQTLAVALLWKYVDSTVPRPTPKSVVDHDVGPWGGDSRFGVPFADAPADSSRITSIRVQFGSVVDCLELSYDGKSAGCHGNPKGGTLQELSLAPDEYVVAVAGRSGDFVDQLVFTTNKGNTVGGGARTGGKEFSSKGNAVWQDVSLFSVSGRSDERRLTSVNFQWKHRLDLPRYTPSYKSAQSVPLLANVKLVTKDGAPISEFEKAYSGKAAANEYWPKHGGTAVALQLHPQTAGGGGRPIVAGEVVQIRTTEPKAKDCNTLSKYSSSDVYYYYDKGGQREQMWAVVKMIPSDGPVLFGETVYLHNLAECNYLRPDDNGFITCTSEPYGWVFQPA